MADVIPAIPLITCVAPAVHDGDTLRCDGKTVRLWGVDAPELAGSPRCRRPTSWACDPAVRAWGVVARDRVIQLTRAGVSCAPMDMDRYRRTVVTCVASGLDLGNTLVREGLARDYTSYSKGVFLADETRARRARRGMWR